MSRILVYLITCELDTPNEDSISAKLSATSIPSADLLSHAESLTRLPLVFFSGISGPFDLFGSSFSSCRGGLKRRLHIALFRGPPRISNFLKAVPFLVL